MPPRRANSRVPSLALGHGLRHPLVVVARARTRTRARDARDADDADDAPGERSELGGERVSLDDLGPVIVNKDGSLRRIGNWAELTEHERAAAHRSISARNEVRLAALRAAEAANASNRRPALLRPWRWLRRRISAVGNAFRFLGGRLKRWLPVCTAPNCIQ